MNVNMQRPVVDFSGQVQDAEATRETTGPNKSAGLQATDIIEYLRTNGASQPTSKLALDPPTEKPDSDKIDSVFSRLPTQSQQTDLYNVLMLFFQVSKEGKKAMRQMNMAQAESVFSQNMNAAKELRSAAVMNLVGNVIAGAASIGAGLISIGQGVKATKMASQMKVGDEFTQQNNQINQQINAMSAKYQGYSQITQAGGTILKGAFDYMATLEQAAQKESEAYAAEGEAVRQQIKDDAGEFTKLLDQILQVMKEIKASQDQTLKKIWS